jgi:hypothetical protein
MPLETFKKILLFFYSGSVSSLSLKDSIYISSLGSFYLLEDTELYRHCKSSLSSGIDASNWMEAFVLGIQMENEELKQKAVARAPASSPSVDMMKILETLCGEFQTKNESLSREIEELRTEAALKKNEEVAPEVRDKRERSPSI